MKNSIAYAYPTIEPVANVTLHINSTWRTVITSSSLKSLRNGRISVSTMPKPEKMAPATKYGGKMVVCQPGNCETEKSRDTILWTESTSGVESPARMR